MSTPILPLAVWLSGTNQNSIPANDNALRIEALSREIISLAVTAQPASPSDGDTYIIASTHTGAQWSGFSPKDIAIYRGGTWYAWAPTEGLVVNVAGTEYKYDGAVWVALGSGSGTVTSVDATGGVETVAGSAITSTGTIRSTTLVNAQTGTTYTYLTGDRGKLVTHSNAASIAGTLPQATGTFPSGWNTMVANKGAGTLTITPTTSTINGASTLVLTTGQWAVIASDGTNYQAVVYAPSGGVAWGGITGTLASQTDLQAALDAKGAVGIPQNSQSTAYTLVLGDANKHILHPSADTTARIFTIPANSSVAFPVGTAVTFVNQNAGGVITVAITTDTMRLAGAGTTGSRTLAANGMATALKITSTEWIISGTGLT